MMPGLLDGGGGAQGIRFSREWAMPNAKTFEIAPIRAFLYRHLQGAEAIVDPFARNSTWGTITNDLNPDTAAQHHMKAEDFLAMLVSDGVQADAVILDPPYSPRQISECYQAAGLKATMKDTQNGRFMREVRNLVSKLVKPGGKVLSFGWNSVGQGKARGFEIEEILLVCHGGVHNDTICVAERKTKKNKGLFDAEFV